MYQHKNEHLQKQLEKALAYLGESYVLHPNYNSKLHPKHRSVGSLDNKRENK